MESIMYAHEPWITHNYALNNDRYVVYFQPKIDIMSGRIAGAEALVRYRAENGKIISPGVFVPLLERNGGIEELDEYMFKKVCEFQAGRIASGVNTVPVSVNISRKSICRPGTIDKCIGITDSMSVSRSLIPFEITESGDIEDAEIKNHTLELKKAGFSLQMDDFGAGYSSFLGLVEIPFDVLKIDKSMVDYIGKPKGEAIIRHMIGIAHDAGLKVVAEGVERIDQVGFLKSSGCDQIQGYFYYPPIDMAEFIKQL